MSETFIQQQGDSIETPKEVLHALTTWCKSIHFDIDIRNPVVWVDHYAVLNWSAGQNWPYPSKMIVRENASVQSDENHHQVAVLFMARP